MNIIMFCKFVQLNINSQIFYEFLKFFADFRKMSKFKSVKLMNILGPNIFYLIERLYFKFYGNFHIDSSNLR